MDAPCLKNYDNEEELLVEYWKRGYEYSEISTFLSNFHDVDLRQCAAAKVQVQQAWAIKASWHQLQCRSEGGHPGCPLITRSDPGTENVTVAAMQATFRANARDEFAGLKSHQYGKSVHNQRIEAFWSHLKPRISWWREVFQSLNLIAGLIVQPTGGGASWDVTKQRKSFNDTGPSSK
ncbi:hypothetical protein Bbelb_100300 [Branchiostoma belcheri]|nr:hypothetical protein Bbelb_100300 [Branchiostoma belcheri]